MSVPPNGARPNRAAYVPAVGPRLRVLLWFVFALLALLGANSAYLAGVRLLDVGFGLDLVNWFVPWMLLAHVALGVVLTAPLVAFGTLHMFGARRRKNRRAVRVGYALFAASLVLLVTGFALCRIDGVFDLSDSLGRGLVYGLHVAAPPVCLWLYWLHRLAGRRINWRMGGGYAAATAAFVAVLVGMHTLDPRRWDAVTPEDGAAYFEPSLARTDSGDFIPASALMNDATCAECHPDVHAQWSHSAHRFSSFNNPLYLASVRETRAVALERDGDVRAARWCAGCHDPVPFFSGQFDDPAYDDVADPTAHAGITCTVCHAITAVGGHGGVRGNADYTIEAPEPYPFENSGSPALKWINRQLIKAKPAVHRKDMLKPLHSSAEFCATCHKVAIPEAVNNYKWLRGQNHYDSFLLSGVSGGGAQSFYYPPAAEVNCNRCHMPDVTSGDFGAKLASGGERFVHDHTFPGANTALARLNDDAELERAHREFLTGSVRVDLFGLRRGGRIDGELVAPLRPERPALVPGEPVLLETVVRTLTLGHLFTQGTTDSNEVWVEVTVTSGDAVLASSGRPDPATGDIDPAAHFLNSFVVDRDGDRITRRNPQAIFTKLYDHQIPPGAAATIHYRFTPPPDLDAPVTIRAAVKYRKFNPAYMRFVHGSLTERDDPLPDGFERMPVVTLATDEVTLPVAGGRVPDAAEHPGRSASPDFPAWQRWNDYGIGLFLKGTAELRQAAGAFRRVEELGRYDGPLNLARVLHAEGRLDEAGDALARAADDPAAPAWTVDWLAGVLNREQGRLAEAEGNFRDVLRWDRPPTPEMAARGFDFADDYRVAALLGRTLYDRARTARGEARRDEREALLREAAATFRRVLEVDIENVAALDNLARIHRELGEEGRAAEARALHAKYKPDDNATDRALRLAREKYPDAARAAEDVVIYELK